MSFGKVNQIFWEFQTDHSCLPSFLPCHFLASRSIWVYKPKNLGNRKINHRQLPLRISYGFSIPSWAECQCRDWSSFMSVISLKSITTWVIWYEYQDGVLRNGVIVVTLGAFCHFYFINNIAANYVKISGSLQRSYIEIFRLRCQLLKLIDVRRAWNPFS
jgi:hypothetical protein